MPQYNRLNGFLTFYYFNADDVKTNSGLRLSASYFLFRWLSFEGETNFDNHKTITSYLGAKFTWDFSKLKPSYLGNLNRKITRVPTRDIDIVNAISESEPVANHEEEIDGLSGVIFAKEAVENEAIINSDGIVPYGIVEKVDINQSALSLGQKIVNITLIADQKNNIRHVNSNDPAKQATSKEYEDYNISDINLAIISSNAKIEFRKTIADVKIAENKIAPGQVVTFKLLTLEEAVGEGVLSSDQGAVIGINSGMTKSELLATAGITNANINNAIGSIGLSIEDSVTKNYITPENGAVLGINSGMTRSELLAIAGITSTHIDNALAMIYLSFNQDNGVIVLGNIFVRRTGGNVRPEYWRLVSNDLHNFHLPNIADPLNGLLAGIERLPLVPVMLPYTISPPGLFDGGNVAVYSAVKVTNPRYMPEVIKVEIENSGISYNDVDLFIVPQTAPWEGTQLLLRPHPWLHPNAPYSDLTQTYGVNTPTRSYHHEIGSGNLIQFAGNNDVFTHTNGSPYITYSPNNLAHHVIPIGAPSSSLYTLVIDPATKKAAVTYHMLLGADSHLDYRNLVGAGAALDARPNDLNALLNGIQTSANGFINGNYPEIRRLINGGV